MARKEIGTAWDRDSRNAMNDNDKELFERTNGLQEQINQLVADGDSSPEAAQARVDEGGKAHTTLKERLDTGFSEVNQRIEDTDSRIDEIITTPAEGITEQEIIDARQGAISLGANLTDIKKEVNTQKAEYESQFYSATNLISSGDFPNATAWIAHNSTISAAANVLTVTGNGNFSAPRVAQSTGVQGLVGEKYYTKATVRVTNSESTAISSRLSAVTGGVGLAPVVRVDNPIQGQWYDITGVHELNADSRITFELYHSYPSNAQALGKNMEVKQVLMINLTRIFGAGNEPNVDVLNALLKQVGWFSGTLSRFAAKNYLTLENKIADAQSSLKKEITEIRRVSEREVLSGFESGHNWTKVSGSDPVADTTNVKHGSQGVKLPSVNGGASVMSRTYAGLNLKDKEIGFWAYVDDNTKLEHIILYATSGSWTKYLQNEYKGVTREVATGWNYLTLTLSDWRKIGGATLDDLKNVTELRLRVKATTGNTVNVTFDKMEMATVTQRRPKIGFRFDDGQLTVFNNAKKILDKHGFRASAAVIPNIVGTNDEKYMNVEHLKKLKEAGWSISSHTYSHQQLPTLTDNELMFQLLESQRWIAQRGLGGRTMCIPYGLWSPRVLDKIKNVFDVASCSREQCVPQNLVDRGMLPCYFGTNTSLPVSQVKALVDKAVANNQTLFLGYHGIAETTNDHIEYTIQEFTEIVDYVASLDVDVVTLDDMIEEHGRNDSTPFTSQILIDAATNERFVLRVNNGVLSLVPAPL